METLTAVIIALGTGLAGSFSGWFFARKRQHIDNIDAATDTWKKIVCSLEEQISKLLASRVSDSEKIEKMSGEISKLTEEIDALKSKLKKTEQLERKITKYEKLLSDNAIDYLPVSCFMQNSEGNSSLGKNRGSGTDSSGANSK